MGQTINQEYLYDNEHKMMGILVNLNFPLWKFTFFCFLLTFIAILTSLRLDFIPLNISLEVQPHSFNHRGKKPSKKIIAAIMVIVLVVVAVVAVVAVVVALSAIVNTGRSSFDLFSGKKVFLPFWLANDQVSIVTLFTVVQRITTTKMQQSSQVEEMHVGNQAGLPCTQ